MIFSEEVKKGIHREVLNNYLRLRKAAQREETRKRSMRPGANAKQDNNYVLSCMNQIQSNRRRRSDAEILQCLDPHNKDHKRMMSDAEVVQGLYPAATKEFHEELMKELIGHLPKKCCLPKSS